MHASASHGRLRRASADALLGAAAEVVHEAKVAAQVAHAHNRMKSKPAALACFLL